MGSQLKSPMFVGDFNFGQSGKMVMFETKLNFIK